MVPKVGIEPTHLSVLDFESGVSISLSKSCNFDLGLFIDHAQKALLAQQFMPDSKPGPRSWHNPYTQIAKGRE